MSNDPQLSEAPVVGGEPGIFLIAERATGSESVGYLGKHFTRYAGHMWSCSRKVSILTNATLSSKIKEVAAQHNLIVRPRLEHEPLLV